MTCNQSHLGHNTLSMMKDIGKDKVNNRLKMLLLLYHFHMNLIEISDKEIFLITIIVDMGARTVNFEFIPLWTEFINTGILKNFKFCKRFFSGIFVISILRDFGYEA